MLLSASTPRPPLSNPNSHAFNLHFCTNISSLRSLRPYVSNHSRLLPFFLFTHASSSLTNPKPHTLRHVSNHDEPEGPMVSSASAVASTIRRASTSPVEFLQRTEKDHKSRLVLPSPDFQRLCIEQLDLFRRILDPDAQLSVYVRPAGSYVMDRLELRRATVYPGGVDVSDTVILVGTFGVPTGLRAAEAALSNQQVEVFVPENRAVVFPMVKNPFVVGFLVAELPMLEPGACEDGLSDAHDLIHYFPSPEEEYSLPPGSGIKSWEIISVKDEPMRMYRFSAEQRANAINIARSLAMAYVMDQKAMLLQQSSWQNNVRMCDLVEQIRGPLSSIRTLGKMLSVQLKKSEISYDIVKDILVQGDHIRDTLQQLQDAVYLTKANIVHYNDETLKKVHNSTYAHESVRSQLPNNLSSDGSKNKVQKCHEPLSLNAVAKDLEMPLPPLALAPLQHGIR